MLTKTEVELLKRVRTTPYFKSFHALPHPNEHLVACKINLGQAILEQNDIRHSKRMLGKLGKPNNDEELVQRRMATEVLDTFFQEMQEIIDYCEGEIRRMLSWGYDLDDIVQHNEMTHQAYWSLQEAVTNSRDL